MSLTFSASQQQAFNRSVPYGVVAGQVVPASTATLPVAQASFFTPTPSVSSLAVSSPSVAPTTLPPTPMVSTALQPAFLNAGAKPTLQTFNAVTASQAVNNGLVKGRTKGMWLFDTLVYPVINNFGVFALSVFATYATTAGKPGNIFRKRGDLARAALENGTVIKLPKQLLSRFKLNNVPETIRVLPKFSPKGAAAAVMVACSFFDGCFVAPFVKLLEDRRGTLSRQFDGWLGSTPADTSIYDKEPRQSWGSVLSGRLATSMVVVPVALALGQKWGLPVSLNDALFNIPGKKAGELLSKNIPAIQKAFPNLDLPKLAEIIAFEFFYTGVCTAGLYVSSRFFARLKEQRATLHAAAVKEAPVQQAVAPSAVQAPASVAPSTLKALLAEAAARQALQTNSAASNPFFAQALPV